MHSVRSLLVASLTLLAVPATGRALTTPQPGAVALPTGLDIRLPFEAGESCYLSAGYSPSGGSSLHDGTDEAWSANDYYALDFILPQYGNNGLGQPVLAVASGTVVKAGWATAGWANYGLRVIIQHDFSGDGHTYISLYAHLNALSVSEGDHVDQGTVIGELGDSCDGGNQELSCPHFAPHLHFAMHQDSYIGGSGTGGSYGGHAVVPEPFDGYEDLHAGQTLISGNSGQPPQPCHVIEPEETILEESGTCFSRRGTPSYWHEETVGHDGGSLWTYTTDDTQPDNHAYFNLHFAQADQYALWAYIPAAFGQSAQASYTVRHDGTETVVTVSQAGSPDAWLYLGSFAFAAGGDQWVLLTDNTGEEYTGSGSTTLAFDALKVAPDTGCQCSPADPPQTQPCARCGTQTRACDGCRWPDWSTVACEGQGECEAGDSEQDPTGCWGGTTRERICQATCEWGQWSDCEEPPGPDAGAGPGPDAGAGPGPDAGAGPGADSGAAQAPDAATPGSDGAPKEPAQSGDLVTGCGCNQKGGGGGAIVLIVLLTLGMISRRERRS